jgi:hypothetical protein
MATAVVRRYVDCPYSQPEPALCEPFDVTLDYIALPGAYRLAVKGKCVVVDSRFLPGERRWLTVLGLGMALLTTNPDRLYVYPSTDPDDDRLWSQAIAFTSNVLMPVNLFENAALDARLLQPFLGHLLPQHRYIERIVGLLNTGHLVYTGERLLPGASSA